MPLSDAAVDEGATNMCRSKADGGQRCYGHTATRIFEVRRRLDVATDPAERTAAEQQLHEAYIDLASTPEGEAEIRELIERLPVASISRALRENELARGLEVRERNAAVYRAVTEARQREVAAREAAEVAATTSVTQDGTYRTEVGSKYTGYRDAAVVAKDVRADIKEAIASGELPQEIDGHTITYAVRTRKYAGGQSIDVTIQGAPDSFIYGPRDEYGYRRPGAQSHLLSRRVQGMLDAYRRTTSDPHTDYMNTTFHALVEFDDERTTEWNAYDKRKRKLVSAYRKARAVDSDEAARLHAQIRALDESWAVRRRELNDREMAEQHAAREEAAQQVAARRAASAAHAAGAQT